MSEYNETLYRNAANELIQDFKLVVSGGKMHDLCDIVEQLETQLAAAKGELSEAKETIEVLSDANASSGVLKRIVTKLRKRDYDLTLVKTELSELRKENEVDYSKLPETVERRDDMSRTGKLSVMRQDDGDIIVSIAKYDNTKDDASEVHYEDGWISVEFCSLFSGGGRSKHTLDALRFLMQAIQKDNEERAIDQ